MRRMVEEFHAHLRNQELPASVLDRFQKLLSDADYDMETLIDVVEGIETGMEKERLLGLSVDEDRLSAFRVIKQEAEWFVQHICERVTESYADMLSRACSKRRTRLSNAFITASPPTPRVGPRGSSVQAQRAVAGCSRC